MSLANRACIALACATAVGCGGRPTGPGETVGSCASSPSAFLAKSTFHVPDLDGEDNENGFIGYFCCTGITGTVRSRCGDAVGYFYFFSWDGSAFNTSDGDSAVTDIRLDLTGSRDVQTPRTPHDTGSVSFLAGVDEIGATRQARVGDLDYSITLERAELYGSVGSNSYWRMSSLAVRYDVALTDEAQARLREPRSPYHGTGGCTPSDTSGWSCEVLPEDSCSYELPAELATEQCGTQLQFSVDYINGWNSYFELVPMVADCATGGLNVRADYTAIDLCPRFCTKLMDMAAEITLRSNAVGCAPAR